MTHALSRNLREPDRLGRKNLTRQTRDLPRKLLREGKLQFLGLYWLMMQSDLGREGIEHSGSYRFADHIYRNQPSGRSWLGRAVDALLLRMPATQAFHRRYLHAQDAVRAALQRHPINSPFRLLAVPCGIPRDIAELPSELRARIQYVGMDLDPEVLRVARAHLSGLRSAEFIQGDALNASNYPSGKFHCIISTGLGEFLRDDELLVFYKNVHAKLESGGSFYTSATNQEPRSEAMLKAFELHTRYRNTAHLHRVLETFPWRSVNLIRDPTGLQTFAFAEK